MDEPSPEIWLARHGETTWSRDWLHSSVTDVPLTERGVEQARDLAHRLAGRSFALVLTSPRSRARRTAELAGFADAVVDADLVEWQYGEYEGISTAEIRTTVPAWTVWDHPTPGADSADEVGARADRVLERARGAGGDVLLFGHAHALRVLTARWLGLDAVDGRLFRLDTGSISVLGYERATPVIRTWNAGRPEVG
jgi:probable phosphoglycerate mutase